MLTFGEMLETFGPHDGEYRLLVGFEYEVFLFDAETLAPLPYPRLRELLQEAARRTGGSLVDEPVVSNVWLPSGALLSVEPGGQFEFSSAPESTFSACIDQLQSFLELVDGLTESMGLRAFYGGVNPVHTIDEIGLVLDKPRYRIMNDYFPRVGTMGRRMMRQSCSVQVTFDYQNAAIGAELLRTAAQVSPIAAALLSNAPYVDGKRTDYRSFRVPIWDNTDPARSGLPAALFEDGAPFEEYLRHVLRAPMFFFKTANGLVDAQGMTFERFNAEGAAGKFPSIDDFVLHNSTIFTDVRLKRTVEVRAVDGQDPALVPGSVALLCGLLLCSAARERTRAALARAVPDHDFAGLRERLAREGLAGVTGDRPTRKLVLDLLDVAEQGLINCFPDGQQATRHLAPLRALADRKLTPADVVLQRFDDARSWLAAGRTFTADDDLLR